MASHRQPEALYSQLGKSRALLCSLKSRFWRSGATNTRASRDPEPHPGEFSRMTKSKTQRRKKQTAKSAFALATDEFKRLTWQSRILRVSSWIALMAVEGVVAWFIADHAPDPLSASILTSMAVVCGLGIALGPSYVLALRQGKQRKIGWAVITACLFISGWNLSTTIGTNWSELAAAEAQASPTYRDDVARLTHLNRSIDALADEVGGMYGNQDQTYSNMLAERDRLQERVDEGRSEFQVFGTPEAWVRGLGFHAIILGFSAAFAMAGISVPRRQRRKTKAPATWPYVQADGQATF